MKITYMGRTIQCDRCTETDGKLTIYQDGLPSIEIANIPDLGLIETEDGIIEHILTPLEQAQEDINDLQADLAEKTAEAAQWYQDYLEIFADNEAKRSRLDRIEALLDSLDDVPTLQGLIAFVRNLREIISEVH